MTIPSMSNREVQLNTLLRRALKENAALRCRLAHLTAQHIWAEGGSFGQIEREVKEFGYRLVKADAYAPRLVPIEEAPQPQGTT